MYPSSRSSCSRTSITVAPASISRRLVDVACPVTSGAGAET
jgi:hypothetical protein